MKYLLPIVLLVLLSCKKTEDRNCFKTVGELTTREIALEDFDKLYLGPHLKYVLVQDTVNKVVLTGGKNLLNFIEASIDEEKRLNLRNINKCNFLRDYDKVVTAEIHVKKIVNILFEGTHELLCPLTLNTDYMAVVIRDGAGKVNLLINAYELYANVTYGWGNFELTGTVNYLNLQINGNGFGTTYDLHVNDSLDIVSNTSETLKVNADGCKFRPQILSNGSIWYIGVPASVTLNTYGTGELVDKN